MKFTDLGLSEDSLKIINEIGFDTPSEIQKIAIPHLLNSEDDFVGQAQTGTGKTAAFVFPIIERIKKDSNHIQVLILAPTRELANQVCEEFNKLGKYSNIKTQAIFGGTSYDRQINGIKRNKPQVIVGTPGRVMDLMKRGVLNFKHAEYLILDEADEMLNMGFFEDVQEIIQQFNKEKKMWMFSATMPTQIARLIKKNFKNPHFVSAEKQNISNDDIEQQYYLVKSKYHKDALCRLIDSHPDMYGIVFCKTRLDTNELADDLLYRGYNIESLHGEMGQAERDRAMKGFKDKKASLMICTDVASRGIDVNNLTHVINYGLPQDFESYVHRIGRTGRAGLKGIAITLVDPRSEIKFKRVEKFTGKKITLKKLPSIDQMKSSLVSKELEGINGVITAVSTKGDNFKVDNTYEIFEKSFENLSKDEILKTMFTWSFNKSMRKLDDIGDLNHTTASRSTTRSKSRDSLSSRPHKGRIIAQTGNVRLFLNMGKIDGLNLRSLLDDLSQQTGLRKKEIQNVDLRPRFSFLEIPKKLGKKVLSTRNLRINNKTVRFEYTHT